ncbi:MAG: heavy metal translocating P-type ATPase [Merdibacter sp.]
MNKRQKNVLYRIIASVLLLIVISAAAHMHWITAVQQSVLLLAVYLIIGYDILRKAIKGILHRQVFDENFLMAVATIGAIFLQEYLEGVAVMLFYQIGELFQSVAVGKSRRNIAALMDIRPDYANVMIDGELKQIDPDEIEIGTRIVVQPGERIPIDGVIMDGSSTLNTSALTGESVPRTVKKDDTVISGCINLSGVLEIQTTKNFEDSTVSKILDLVENSSMKKSRSENFITKFARYYTPIVCYSALALAFLPPLFSVLLHQSPQWNVWIIRALTFLVISCPCALVISIPLSFFGGIGCASSKGILVKGSNYLEILSDAKIFLFDKTGTLTKGVFEVSEIHAAMADEDTLLFYAAYAESGSTHPIAQSIRKAYRKQIDRTLVCNITETAGMGINATVNGHQVSIGNRRLMSSMNLSLPPVKQKGTLVHVALDHQYLGFIVISDCLKPTSADAIRQLKAAGIKKTVLLSGDNEAVVKQIGTELCIDEVHGALLPADKVEKVETYLEQAYGNDKVVFVGDGINDAPVLSRADIGIAMGGLGSDAAIEAADIVLMDDDPSKIALAMRISKKTLQIVHQNIAFALFVKLVCLILGAFGIANMWLAIFADVGVMVIAVMNAMRCLKI